MIELAPLAGVDEKWRAQKYNEALERGDPWADDWQKVVPISCARGRHRWRERDGFTSCECCDEVEEPVL